MRSRDQVVGLFVIIFFRLWMLSFVHGDDVTLIPPENLLQMLMSDGMANALNQLNFKLPKNAGVLSGVPIPTLWPVLPIPTTTMRSVKTLTQLVEDNRNKQLMAAASPFSALSNAILGNAGPYGPSPPNSNGFLSQLMQPSQTNPFMAPQISSLFPSQQQDSVNMIQQFPQNFQQPNFNDPQNFNGQQPNFNQMPIGQTFGNFPPAQTNSQLTSQDILLNTFPGSQQKQLQQNPFGQQFLPETPQQSTLQQNVQFNSPSQVYGYGSQSLLANQIQQTNGQQLVNGQQLDNMGNLIQQGPGFGNSLEERYPGCHK